MEAVMKAGYVYIMSNEYRTTFYVGVTSSLTRRIEEHRFAVGSRFTSKYRLKDLMYYETLESMTEAVAREKQLKRWHRDWKLNLIRSANPDLKDLSGEVIEIFGGDAETSSACQS